MRRAWLVIAGLSAAVAGTNLAGPEPGSTLGSLTVTASQLSRGAPIAARGPAAADRLPAATVATSPLPDMPVAVARRTARATATPRAGIAGLTVSFVRTATVQGIPRIALEAYKRAALDVSTTSPGCGMQWPLLAAIGEIESNHGDNQFTADGTRVPRVLGPVLDGSPGTALIRDTDHGVLDGNRVYDRAVGPMQFLPSTWRTWASDGNGDGRADPENIFDASLAAARYLCAAGGDLATPAAQIRAVFSYNHATWYVAVVRRLAAAYASGVPVIPGTVVLPAAVPAVAAHRPAATPSGTPATLAAAGPTTAAASPSASSSPPSSPSASPPVGAPPSPATPTATTAAPTPSPTSGGPTTPGPTASTPAGHPHPTPSGSPGCPSTGPAPTPPGSHPSPSPAPTGTTPRPSSSPAPSSSPSPTGTPVAGPTCPPDPCGTPTPTPSGTSDPTGGQPSPSPSASPSGCPAPAPTTSTAPRHHPVVTPTTSVPA